MEKENVKRKLSQKNYAKREKNNRSSSSFVTNKENFSLLLVQELVPIQPVPGQLLEDRDIFVEKDDKNKIISKVKKVLISSGYCMESAKNTSLFCNQRLYRNIDFQSQINQPKEMPTTGHFCVLFRQSARKQPPSTPTRVSLIF